MEINRKECPLTFTTDEKSFLPFCLLAQEKSYLPRFFFLIPTLRQVAARTALHHGNCSVCSGLVMNNSHDAHLILFSWYFPRPFEFCILDPLPF